jgi:hypothetical protein
VLSKYRADMASFKAGQSFGQKMPDYCSSSRKFGTRRDEQISTLNGSHPCYEMGSTNMHFHRLVHGPY